ncbi:RING and PHD-finger domain-containing protein KIAA1542 [Camponotus floridanus]|uniref:RING and PHD-finger domain-containing protein KIAA1542 n=1 Tax=Camponotus floridanus TaxID=104421 RepID=E2B0H8_CAMFO|nr:RING and PHD-finger domain-containing protein KIAA1542 [Camponotus floridanus]
MSSDSDYTCMRVVSEGENSSDDSDVPKPVIRRQNHRVISEDESNYDSNASEASKSTQSDSSTTTEWQSDWSSSDELNEDCKKYNAKCKVLSKKREEVGNPGPSSSSNADVHSSDSSDEQSEKCPICLLPFRKQQVGTPSACDHCFCLDCLVEWSKNINTCPVDRQSFTVIHVRDNLRGEIIKHVPVEIVPRIENQAQDDPTFCEICHQSDREDRMLLCDNCDRGYHLECLTPPMTAVPIEEWFCPDCTIHTNNRMFVTNFLPSIMISSRRPSQRILQFDSEHGLGIFRRIFPHIRNVDDDRTYVPASLRNRRSVQTREVRDDAPADIPEQFIDPNLPSTSSGLDSIGDNSRSRSPNTSLEGNASSSTRSNKKCKTKTTKRKKKKLVKNSERSSSSLLREVRITELNDDGEEEEIVTFVKVASSTSRRKCKKRTKKTRKRRKHKRRVRTVASVLNKKHTVKRRLASTLGMKKPKVPLLVPTMKSNTPIPEKSALINARYSAGIPQVSLFGNNLGINYSPPGSDEDDNEYSIGNGPLINIRQRRSAVPSIRRRAILKSIANPIDEVASANAMDLLSSIMNNQELWHSTKKKDDVILKADGTLIVNNPDKENKHSINNNESPKKEKQNEKEISQRKEPNHLKVVDTPLDLSNVNPNDITQAPMYNNPCGGGSGGGGNRGNFRGGYGRDNSRHGSHGGQSYGGRDSLPPGGGRHSYSSGTGSGGPRDNFGNRDFGPPPFYNPNFEHCGGPPMFGAHAPPPPFRSRNPQHFRNERLRFPPPPPPPIERPFNYTDGDHLNVQPPVRLHNSLSSVNLPEDTIRNYRSSSPEQNDRIVVPEPVAAPATTRQDNDDCDIYCDIEPPSKPDSDVQEELHSNGSMILLPPPEPPSGLLDFEENSRSDKDNDSEQELVIDDSHKEDTPKDVPTSGDKYDPFAADSDSNDDVAASLDEKVVLEKVQASRNSLDSRNIPMPPLLISATSYPPMPTVAATTAESRERPQEPIRLTAYDDDDDNDSQSDCPNFSIYSSQTMDVARHTEQELSQQLGPLQPPPLPPNIPDDDDIIVGDVQACDLPDVPPEPADPYVEALQKERQTLSKIPPKKISHDLHRGKITFKIGNKLKLNNRLSGLHSDDHSINSQNPSFQQKKVLMAPLIEEQQQQERDPDSDKTISSSKSTMESTAIRSSIALNQLIGPQLAEEDDKSPSTEIATPSSFKKKKPLRFNRRESEEIDSESSDEEVAKMDEMKSRRVNVASPSRKEVEDCEQETSPRPAATADENITVEESTISSAFRLSPKKLDDGELNIECNSQDLEGSDATTSKAVSSHSNDVLQEEASACDDDLQERESSSEDYDRSPSSDKPAKVNHDDNDDNDNDDKTSSDPNEDPNSSDQRQEKASFSMETVIDDEIEQFPIEKEKLEDEPSAPIDNNWDSDGAYTPCKDELPVRDESAQVSERRAASFEVGLEPITPTKDKTNDDLDDCRTPPAGYAELGTEAISETDEAINFEEELNALALRKEKEMEDGEILDESKLNAKEREKSKEEKEEEDNKRKKKKDKKEKNKESTEKNKENISSDNLVAWKKLSKSTKERPYRDKDKRSKSKEKEKDKDKDKSSKKKTKEVGKKKEKRKELPRYDVRKIVAEKPSRPRKDEYGRDIREKSRSRSRSRSSDKIRSGSRDRRSRSYSKGRSRSRSRLRLSWSRDRGRSYSRSCRSISRKRSSSRTKRKTSRRRSISRRRSLSRRHSVSRRRSRSLSRKRQRSLSPRRRSRRSLSRSRDKRKDKTKKYKSRSRSRNRKRSRSKSPKRMSSKSREKKHSKRKMHSRSRSKGRSISRDRDRNRNWDQLNEKSVDHEQQFPREREEHERSWSAQWTPSWSRSRSKTPPHIQQEPIGSRNWSPPPVLNSVSPKNLTVILTNKEAIKKKKKERRKESRKSKEMEKRRKSKRNRTPPPSKEVFASGDNILVSVCFNKDNETNPVTTPELPQTIPLVPPIKRRRRESVQTESSVPSAKRSKKEKTKDKRSKSPKVKKDKKKKSKAAEIAATKKPVAVIDLDQSPFREQTPSPRDVIVLSDDDDKQAQEALAASPEQCPPSQASPPREQFVSQDERVEEELEMRAQEELELRLKIGPNTPPEPPTSPPTSPDAYDPFDPTKSRSPTPDASQEATPNDDRDRAQRNSPRKHDGTVDAPLPLDEPNQQQDQPSQEKPMEKPKIISMVTIKRPSPQRDVSAASPVPENQTDIAQSCNSPPPKTQQNPQSNVQSTANPFATINPVLATVAAAVQRSFNTSTTNTTQRTLLQSNRISPSNQMKQRTNDRPQLPNVFANSAKSSTMARSSKSTQNKNSSTIGQNGSDAPIDMTNDNVVDMSSPYSPGSTLSDGLFDPPSPANFNNSPVANAPPPAAAKATAPKVNKSAEKKDAFDALFSGILPPVKTTTKNRSKKVAKEKTKKSTNPKVGVRMDENQLQILDDLPSSAVEMQVKDKFLKKLNRQERVVEEVKLVLKPHYTKKHVTKEEYKDIMRKAVPKICHNKTGEINPKKIAHLIEAYVRKCRNNKKKTSSAKITKPTHDLCALYAKALDDVRSLSENVWPYIIAVPPQFGFGDLDQRSLN